jgi:hypothetical protein
MPFSSVFFNLQWIEPAAETLQGHQLRLSFLCLDTRRALVGT